jgi:hypothetical protein
MLYPADDRGERNAALVFHEPKLARKGPWPGPRLAVRVISTVMWFGNSEVKGSYGAEVPGIPRLLPRHNSEVMYFSLGQVSNPLLRSLFDRSIGIAIDLPLRTRMLRNAADADEVAIKIPVEDSALIRLHPQIRGGRFRADWQCSNGELSRAVRQDRVGYLVRQMRIPASETMLMPCFAF